MEENILPHIHTFIRPHVFPFPTFHERRRLPGVYFLFPLCRRPHPRNASPTMATQPQTFLTEEEYLAFEREAEEKHEYYAGEIFAFAGASRRHNLITGNFFAALHAQLRDRDCEVFSSDMRVRISPSGAYTYPDVVALCGEAEFADDQHDTLLNPTVIVEMLSPSTADYDRGGKFALYRRLDSLQEYLVVAQDRCHVEQYVRQGDARWLLSETEDPAALLTLDAIGCRLPLAEVYEKVDFG